LCDRGLGWRRGVLGGMSRKEKTYATGFEDGFKAGVESANDSVAATIWDEAFTAGYRACQEELGVRV
jgi:flagellar biosynthesis/type III secretory pathway protein FliH